MPVWHNSSLVGEVCACVFEKIKNKLKNIKMPFLFKFFKKELKLKFVSKFFIGVGFIIFIVQTS
jgi:hypothetical protein